ncbi:hypothetical protein OCU04_012096 [Sclerotinia nivalis]|uniref:Uncharacterized protein n=1 Tax=Sclerotinia nivalis TaxID=352851 RepID=A0A9X0DDT8_9HELO|nr:hypothetical protein OCU04_012096 [Sclerotinia nivalis]
MTSLTPTEIVALLTKPSPKPVPWIIGTRQVRLFQAADSWNTGGTLINIDDYVPNKRHVVPASQYDQASQALYNLPVGTVVTLLAAIQNSGTNVDDLSNCLTCVD